MKAKSLNDNQEIGTVKIKINNLSNQKMMPDNSNDHPIQNNNIKNIVASAKNIQNNNNNNNDNNNYHNNSLNTSNTFEHNNVSPSTIAQLKKIANKADLLNIEIINSLRLQNNLKIEINALGMISNSKRKAYDGNTFFGFVQNYNENEENDDTNDANIDIKDVDFIIKPRENCPDNNNIIGRHFRIRFDINTMKYYIKDLGCGYGTFKKIMEVTKLKDSYLINIGNSYIVCTFGVDEYDLDGKVIADADKILNIKVFSEVPKADPYFFNPQQFKKVYVGRDISCNIIVDDSLLSRVHCTIEFKDDDGWVIYDGRCEDDDPSKYRPSTNGTWLYLIEETQIDDGMIFKSNQNVYECKIIKQDQS